MDDTVVMERVGPVAVLRLNRPAKLNAISYAMADRLLALQYFSRSLRAVPVDFYLPFL